MIQASVVKNYDAKTPTQTSENSIGVAYENEALAEGEAFSTELMASIGDLDVKPVEMSPQQLLDLPSSLINPLPETVSPDAIGPKIFDPAMTRGVEKLIQPNVTEVVTNPELIVDGQMEVLLNQAKLQQGTSRGPAIDFAQSEIDPQLMNLEDFVAQKNVVSKKVLPPNAYGLKSEAAKQTALESGLLQSQVVREVSGAAEGSINSQQFLLGLSVEQGAGKSGDVQSASQIKTFNMSNIKSENTNQIMNQVSDYIIQAKAAKEPTVNLRVNHDELGMIDITVSRAMKGVAQNQEAIAVNIGAHSSEGKNFFQQNSKELFSHLASAGVNVSELKVETPSQTAKSGFEFNQQDRQNQGSEKQFSSEQNQRRHESDRRQALWEIFNKEAA
jgi:hypothetical protein